MELKDLEIYEHSKELSDIAWKMYQTFTVGEKRIFGEQFVRSVDSIGANIAEGFGRYHYLDKNKFNYNARGSLLESMYWLELLEKRGKIGRSSAEILEKKLQILHRKLNSYINKTKEQAQKD